MIKYDIMDPLIDYCIILRNNSVIELTSTMDQSINTTPNVDSKPKFPKSNSFSTVYTQQDCALERDLITRKISHEQKRKMIDLITFDNFNMKQAARFTNISYSTAKKVYAKFRHDSKQLLQNKASSQLCKGVSSYREVGLSGREVMQDVRVVSLVAGKQQRRAGNTVLNVNCDC